MSNRPENTICLANMQAVRPAGADERSTPGGHEKDTGGRRCGRGGNAMRELLENRLGGNCSIDHLGSSPDCKRPIYECLTDSAQADSLKILEDAIEKALNDPNVQEPFSRDDCLGHVLGGRKRFSQGTHPLPMP